LNSGSNYAKLLNMGQIKLVNIAEENVVSLANATDLKYDDARFHVMYWRIEFADVLVHKEDSTYVDSPSVAATLTATTVTETPASVGYGIADVTTVQNIGVAMEANGKLKMFSGAGATTADALTMTNQCSVPVMFELTLDAAPSLTWTVPPNEGMSVATGEVFTAYARVHSYPYEPVGSDGYDTPTVAFNTPTTTLKVAPNNSKGESYHIDVG
jgi:hypothetical protein